MVLLGSSDVVGVTADPGSHVVPRVGWKRRMVLEQVPILIMSFLTSWGRGVEGHYWSEITFGNKCLLSPFGYFCPLRNNPTLIGQCNSLRLVTSFISSS